MRRPARTWASTPRRNRPRLQQPEHRAAGEAFRRHDGNTADALRQHPRLAGVLEGARHGARLRVGREQPPEGLHVQPGRLQNVDQPEDERLPPAARHAGRHAGALGQRERRPARASCGRSCRSTETPTSSAASKGSCSRSTRRTSSGRYGRASSSSSAIGSGCSRSSTRRSSRTARCSSPPTATTSRAATMHRGDAAAGAVPAAATTWPSTDCFRATPAPVDGQQDRDDVTVVRAADVAARAEHDRSARRSTASSVDCTEALAQAAARPACTASCSAADQTLGRVRAAARHDGQQDDGARQREWHRFLERPGCRRQHGRGELGPVRAQGRAEGRRARRRCATARRRRCTSSSAWRTAPPAAPRSSGCSSRTCSSKERGWQDLPELGSGRELPDQRGDPRVRSQRRRAAIGGRERGSPDVRDRWRVRSGARRRQRCCRRPHRCRGSIVASADPSVVRIVLPHDRVALADVFMAGYGFVWIPPPARADQGDFSVGYDVYDRFDLGQPGEPDALRHRRRAQDARDDAPPRRHRASTSISSSTTTASPNLGTPPGFVKAGGYPGLAHHAAERRRRRLPLRLRRRRRARRLAGLIDIAHEKNHRFIRNPVARHRATTCPPAPSGIRPARQRARPRNRRFYPDIGHQTIRVFDPRPASRTSRCTRST